MSLPYYKSTLMAKLNKSLQAIDDDKENITRWYGSHGDKEIVRQAQHNDGLLNSHFFNNHKNRKRKISEQKQHEWIISETSPSESEESEPETYLPCEDDAKSKEHIHKSNKKKESELNGKRGNKMKWKGKNNVIVDDNLLDSTDGQWVSCDILRLIDAALLHGVPEDIIANNVQILATAMHESVQREAQINALRHHSRVMAFEMREVLNCMSRTNLQLEQRDSNLENINDSNINKIIKQEKEEISENRQEHKTYDTKNIVNEHHSTHEETDQEKARAVLFIRRQSALSRTVDNAPNRRHYNAHSAPSLAQLITSSHSPTLESWEETQKYEEYSFEQPEKSAVEYGNDDNAMATHNTKTNFTNLVHNNLNRSEETQPSSRKQTSLSSPEHAIVISNTKRTFYNDAQHGNVEKLISHKQPVLLSRPIIHRSAFASESSKHALNDNESGVVQSQENNKYSINKSHGDDDDNNNDDDANDTECRHRTHHHRLCETCARLDSDDATLQNYKNHNLTQSSSAIKHHMLPTHSSIRMHRRYYDKGNNELLSQEDEHLNEESNIKEVHESSKTASLLEKEQMSNYTKPLFRYRPSIPVRQTHTSQLRLSRSRSNTNNSNDNANNSNVVDQNDNAYVVENEKGNVENTVEEYTHKDAIIPWKYCEEEKILADNKELYQENEEPLREPPHLPAELAIGDALKDITANTMIGVESYNDNAISSNNSNLIDGNNNDASSNAVVSNVYSAKAKRAIRQALQDSKEKMRNADTLLQQCTMNTLSQQK